MLDRGYLCGSGPQRLLQLQLPPARNWRSPAVLSLHMPSNPFQAYLPHTAQILTNICSMVSPEDEKHTEPQHCNETSDSQHNPCRFWTFRGTLPCTELLHNVESSIHINEDPELLQVECLPEVTQIKLQSPWSPRTGIRRCHFPLDQLQTHCRS